MQAAAPPRGQVLPLVCLQERYVCLSLFLIFIYTHEIKPTIYFHILLLQVFALCVESKCLTQPTTSRAMCSLLLEHIFNLLWETVRDSYIYVYSFWITSHYQDHCNIHVFGMFVTFYLPNTDSFFWKVPWYFCDLMYWYLVLLVYNLHRYCVFVHIVY